MTAPSPSDLGEVTFQDAKTLVAAYYGHLEQHILDPAHTCDAERAVNKILELNHLPHDKDDSYYLGLFSGLVCAGTIADRFAEHDAGELLVAAVMPESIRVADILMYHATATAIQWCRVRGEGVGQGEVGDEIGKLVDIVNGE